MLHVLQNTGHKLGLGLWRGAAIRQTLEWIVRHQDADGAWGGIQPPWIYSLMALYIEGYAIDHPVLAKGLEALNDPGWRVDEGEATFIGATNSPVWDTMLTLLAFDDAGLMEEYPKEVETAAEWLLDRQVRVPGDWSVKLPHVKPGGWAFEYANNAYPDIDDTAVALIALAPFRNHPKWQAKGIEEAIQLGVDWLIAMQSRGGGWGAFDKDNDKKLLTKIPFGDFGEVLDPPSADVTAHVVEAFGKLGISREHPAMVRALDYLRREQEPSGAWFGRWGVNYVYGTAAVLPALAAIGEDMTQSYIGRACDWLAGHQQENGGWGESCASYMDVTAAGRGTATASQTAWALMALLAANRPQDAEAIERGCLFLIERQTGGTWDEPEYTGTGFPGYGVGQTIKLQDPLLSKRLMQGPELSRAFMLRYGLYRHYFPLMALGRRCGVCGGRQGSNRSRRWLSWQRRRPGGQTAGCGTLQAPHARPRAVARLHAALGPLPAVFPAHGARKGATEAASASAARVAAVIASFTPAGASVIARPQANPGAVDCGLDSFASLGRCEQRMVSF